MVNGREKGANAEREVAALLKEWWRQHEADAEFVRTPQSGGWGTPKLRGDFKAAGDVATKSADFPYTVEVKRREGWTLGRFIAGGGSPVWSWWQQAIKESREEGRVPMLWLRKNRCPWLVVLPSIVLARVHPRLDIAWPMTLRVDRTGGVHPGAVFAESLLATPPASHVLF